jgi:hypothetical protein
MGIPEGGVRYRPGGSRKGKVMGWSLIENYIVFILVVPIKYFRNFRNFRKFKTLSSKIFIALGSN